jgi:hypothetical protein
MENLELNLKLTVAHINLVLAHLAKGAYADVADLITLLHGQAKPQIEASQAPTVPSTTDVPAE